MVGLFDVQSLSLCRKGPSTLFPQRGSILSCGKGAKEGAREEKVGVKRVKSWSPSIDLLNVSCARNVIWAIFQHILISVAWVRIFILHVKTHIYVIVEIFMEAAGSSNFKLKLNACVFFLFSVF